MDEPIPRAPAHLSRSSKSLWKAVHDGYRLGDHHRKLLVLFCEALDQGEQARLEVARSGAYLTDRFGQLKASPAVGVQRDSAIRAARLLRDLGLDGDDDLPVRPPRAPF